MRPASSSTRGGGGGINICTIFVVTVNMFSNSSTLGVNVLTVFE